MKRQNVRMMIAALVALPTSPALLQAPRSAATTVAFTGHVYNKSGQPLEKIQVSLSRINGEIHIDPVITNDAGRFTFPAVPKDAKTKYYLSLFDPSGNHADKYMTRTLTAASAQIGGFTMDRAGFITGTVCTKRGDEVKPGAGISVDAENLAHTYAVSVAVADDGTFRIARLPAGSYQLTFTDYDRNFEGGCYDNEALVAFCEGTQSVTVKAGETTVINPQVLDNPLERMSGTVSDTNGVGLEGIWLNVFDADDESQWVGGVYSDSDGNWTVKGINHAGPVKLRVTDESGDVNVHTWYENADSWADATRLTLTDGDELGCIGIVLAAH